MHWLQVESEESERPTRRKQCSDKWFSGKFSNCDGEVWIQNPRSRRSPRSLIESSQESKGQSSPRIQSSRVQSRLRSLIKSSQV
jgi:hypothetical protein